MLCVCRQWSPEVPERYLGSPTQGLRDQLILQQVELERMLIGVVMVCSPTNKYESASVSVFAHTTVPTNSAAQEEMHFGLVDLLCSGGTALGYSHPNQCKDRALG